MYLITYIYCDSHVKGGKWSSLEPHSLLIARLEKSKTGEDGSYQTAQVDLARPVMGTISLVYIIMSKAVATDFEVVQPGSGCGLFNMGVVCSM